MVAEQSHVGVHFGGHWAGEHLGDGAAGAEKGDVKVVEAAVLDDLELGGGEALRAMLAAAPEPLAGVNLCASVNGERNLDALCRRLMASGGLELPGATHPTS